MAIDDQTNSLLNYNAGNADMVRRIARDRGLTQEDISQALNVAPAVAARYGVPPAMDERPSQTGMIEMRPQMGEMPAQMGEMNPQMEPGGADVISNQTKPQVPQGLTLSTPPAGMSKPAVQPPGFGQEEYAGGSPNFYGGGLRSSTAFPQKQPVGMMKPAVQPQGFGQEVGAADAASQALPGTMKPTGAQPVKPEMIPAQGAMDQMRPAIAQMRPARPVPQPRGRSRLGQLSRPYGGIGEGAFLEGFNRQRGIF